MPGAVNIMRRPIKITKRQVVVGIALGVGLLHFVFGPSYAGPLRGFMRGHLFDLLLPLALYLLLSLPAVPCSQRAIVRAGLVLGVGVTVEVLQFHGVPVFGSTFDPLDLLMYGLGVTGGVVFEQAVLSRIV